MPPLTVEAQQAGRKAMEKSLTVAQKTSRRLSAGRPSSARFNVFEAAGALVSYGTKAERLLEDAGLNPADFKMGMAYCNAEDRGLIFAGEKSEEFFDKLRKLPAETAFLGLWCQLIDRETDGSLTWVKPFTTDTDELSVLSDIRNRVENGETSN